MKRIMALGSANKLDPFPQQDVVTKMSLEKNLDVELYCSCRLPWSACDNLVKERYTSVNLSIDDCTKDDSEEFFTNMHCVRIANLKGFYTNLVKKCNASW